MSAIKAGLPTDESCAALFVEMLNWVQPENESPLSTDEKTRKAFAAMRDQWKDKMARLYVDCVRTEDYLREQNRLKDEKIKDLEKQIKLLQSGQNSQ